MHALWNLYKVPQYCFACVREQKARTVASIETNTGGTPYSLHYNSVSIRSTLSASPLAGERYLCIRTNKGFQRNNVVACLGN